MNYHQIELTKKQKEELAPFVTRLNKKVKPLCVICFAASAKTTDAQSAFPFITNEQDSIYGVLVITSKEANRQYVQKLANTTAANSLIVAITYNWEYIKGKLRQKNKFFTAVVHKGFVLSGQLAACSAFDFSPNEIYPQAQLYFDYRIEYAAKFLEAASLCRSEDHDGSSLYLLYQAVLQSCFTLIGVYCFYEPNFDDLGILLNFCYCLEPRLEKDFQHDKSVDSFHFDALTGIYRHIHFNNNFEVIDRDTEITSKFVDHFCQKVFFFCNERIGAYKNVVVLE